MTCYRVRGALSDVPTGYSWYVSGHHYNCVIWLLYSTLSCHMSATLLPYWILSLLTWRLMVSGWRSFRFQLPHSAHESRRFLKLLTELADTTWSGRAFQCLTVRWLKKCDRILIRLRCTSSEYWCPRRLYSLCRNWKKSSFFTLSRAVRILKVSIKSPLTLQVRQIRLLRRSLSFEGSSCPHVCTCSLQTGLL